MMEIEWGFILASVNFIISFAIKARGYQEDVIKFFMNAVGFNFIRLIILLVTLMTLWRNIENKTGFLASFFIFYFIFLGLEIFIWHQKTRVNHERRI